ncbi:hypothetical protein L1987_03590 [Smallanthus sonchifolius]|uniref:Uncharacterized protein n=1 Tax=Smallanthus sonchifolius TaxID=185202 RepID=A0ACB9KB83_9ASTR|nr:hypothetical protein L1987_03590 [Smallanthus sonchifolius]
MVAKNLGFKDFIPPYTKVKRKDVLNGVNYASAGSGILDESGDNLGEHFSFNKQILHHKKVISQIETLQGNKTYTKDYLKKCLYTIHIGSNDYINNYFAPKTLHKRHKFSPNQFATILINQLSQNLKASCAPAEKRLFGKRNTCVKEINDALNIFMAKKRILLADLNRNLTDAKFVIPDLDIPKNVVPQFEGNILVNNAPCCKVSTKLRTRGQCLHTNRTCYGRTRYWFFDGFHPTEFANIFYSSKMMLAICKLL